MIYVDVSVRWQRVAEFSVLAHLEKLMREGQVKKEGSRYLLISEINRPSSGLEANS